MWRESNSRNTVNVLAREAVGIVVKMVGTGASHLAVAQDLEQVSSLYLIFFISTWKE